VRRFGLLSIGTVLVVLALGAPAATAAGGHDVVVRLHGQQIVVHPHGRFGIFPTREAFLKGPHTPQASAANLRYGGGIDGIGVTTGAPKVYVVYWGSQWGTASVGGDGYTHLTNDPRGLAPYQQAFFKGAGTGGELWDGVPTQYCEGVAVGSQTCPSNSAHVGYPTGGALAGVWADNSAAAPTNATQAQIAAEAVRTAQHFGNNTAAANRNAEYVVTFPTGTHPDGFPSAGFCAYHDYTTSSVGDVAYTNMPYVPDAGTSCGQNFVNAGSAGTLDGVSIVGGHEFQETTTDQNPAGGWTDTSGEENADKCAWISSGQGASANVTFSTGTFAVQSSWANDFNGGTGGCMLTHPIVTNGGGGGGGQILGNPGFETGTASPWVATAGVIDSSAAEPAHSGSWKAWLDGYGTSHTDSLYQQVAVPSTSSATLTFWLHIDTAETTTTTAFDTLKVQIRNSSNTVLATLATYSNLNKNTGYAQKSFNVTAYSGQTIRVYLLGVEDTSLQTSFVCDDFALNVT
jgi:serine protease